MRRTLALVTLAVGLALLACKKKSADSSSASATGGSDDAPQIHFKTLPVGTKYTEKEAMSMDFSIAVKANGKTLKTLNMKKSEVREEKAEVLAVNDVAPTRLRLTYTRSDDSETDDNGKDKADKSPLTGNTYIVERQASGLDATRLGGDITPKEAEQVKEDNKDLGKRDPFLALLPTGPLVKGQKVAASKDAIRDLFGSKDDAKQVDVDKVELAFTGTRTDGKRTVGDFAVTVGFTGYPDQNMGLQMQLAGTVSVDMDSGQVIAASLSGPIVVKGQDSKHHLDIGGEGKMNMTESYTYE